MSDQLPQGCHIAVVTLQLGQQSKIVYALLDPYQHENSLLDVLTRLPCTRRVPQDVLNRER